MSGIFSDWKVPPQSAKEDDLCGWVREAVQQGRNDLKLQRPYQDMEEALDIIAGLDGSVSDKQLRSIEHSDVRTNRIKRQVREVVSTLSDLRVLGGFRTDNRDLYKQSAILNNLARAWYLNTFTDRAMRAAMQYACVLGTGYLRPIYKRDRWITGRGDLFLEPYAADEVLFVQLPRDNDLQRAYAVIICQEVPIAIAHAMYPDYQDKIVPTRTQPSLLRRGVRAVQKFLSPALNVSGPSSDRNQDKLLYPTVDMFHIYVNDQTVNNTGQTVPMGKPGTSWYYEVPSIGSEIPAGKNSAGQTIYRKAEREDCMLYPLRRLIIATETCRIYDDTATEWHGKVPLVAFTVDDWPWERLGFSLVRDVAPLQRAKNENMRAMQDRIQVALDPPQAYDKNAVSKTDAERLDTRRPRQRLGINMQMNDKPFVPLLPAEYLQVPTAGMEMNKEYDEIMDHQIGIRDIASFAKARMGGSADAMEKFLELAGPIVKDISRGMERSVRDLYEMVKSGFFQYYTAPRRVQMLGEDGITEQDFDYEPGSMIPSHLPGEDQNAPSQKTMLERARYYSQNFYFHITPYSLHNITQMTQKLLFLQLYRAGFPIDPWSVAEAVQIPNFGPPPRGTSSVMERWVAWEDMKMERAVEQAKLAAQVGGGMGPKGGHQGSGGRAPTGGAPPQLKQKDGGARSTVAESR